MIDSREEVQPEAPPARSTWEPVIVAGGLAIAILAAFFSGVLELFLTPHNWESDLFSGLHIEEPARADAAAR